MPATRCGFATRGSYVQVLTGEQRHCGGTGVYTGGGVHFSSGIAMDGASNAWVVNTTFTAPDTGLLSEFSNSGTAITPTTGYVSSTMLAPSGIGVDSSGDVWVSNNGNSTVSEFIGAAVPVTTPLAYGIQVGSVGRRP